MPAGGHRPGPGRGAEGADLRRGHLGPGRHRSEGDPGPAVRPGGGPGHPVYLPRHLPGAAVLPPGAGDAPGRNRGAGDAG